MASKHGPPVSVGGAKSLKPGTQLWMQVPSHSIMVDPAPLCSGCSGSAAAPPRARPADARAAQWVSPGQEGHMQWFRCAISPTQPPQKAKNASSWAGWYGLDFQAFKCADAFDCVRLAREKRLRYTVARATRSAPVRDRPPRAQPPRAQPCGLSAPANAQDLDGKGKGKGQGKGQGQGRAQGDDAAREKAREAARKRAARFSKPPPRPQRETRSSAPETLAPRASKGAASMRLKEQFTHSASPRAAGKRKRPAANKGADGGGGDDDDGDSGGGGDDDDGETDDENDDGDDGDDDDEEEEKGELEVESIVGKGIAADGSILYQVRWRGYGEADDTWEPMSNLTGSKKAIALFEAESLDVEDEEASESQPKKRSRKTAQPDENRPKKTQVRSRRHMDGCACSA